MRLIDENKVIRLLSSYSATGDDAFCDAAEKLIETFIDDINYLPTIDAEPVPHGRWIRRGNRIVCSECEEESPMDASAYNVYSNYCPHCGAKMDLDYCPYCGTKMNTEE